MTAIFAWNNEETTKESERLSYEEVTKEHVLPSSDAIEDTINTFIEENISNLVKCDEDEQFSNEIHPLFLVNLVMHLNEKLIEAIIPEWCFRKSQSMIIFLIYFHMSLVRLRRERAQWRI